MRWYSDATHPAVKIHAVGEGAASCKSSLLPVKENLTDMVLGDLEILLLQLEMAEKLMRLAHQRGALPPRQTAVARDMIRRPTGYTRRHDHHKRDRDPREGQRGAQPGQSTQRKGMEGKPKTSLCWSRIDCHN